MSSVWPADRTAELERLIAKGVSYAAIAASMGLTKNQVIGRAQRLGIERGRTPKAIQRRLSDVAPSGRACRFIAGDPREVRTGADVWCNAPTIEGSAYCAGHHARCYQIVPAKARTA